MFDCRYSSRLSNIIISTSNRFECKATSSKFCEQANPLARVIPKSHNRPPSYAHAASRLFHKKAFQRESHQQTPLEVFEYLFKA